MNTAALTGSQIATLRLFNEKVAEIRGYSFAFQTENAAMIEWTRQTGWDQIYVGASDEKLAATILAIRFFIQNNESISLQRMRSIYESLPTQDPARKRFLDQCGALNDHLDSDTAISIEAERQLTYRDVFEMFIYGRFAHANAEKRQQFQDLSQTPFFPILQTDFAATLNYFIQCLRVLESVNNELLARS